MYPIRIFGMFETSMQAFAITLPINPIFVLILKNDYFFHFTLKNIEKLPKFYPTKTQHYTPLWKIG